MLNKYLGFILSNTNPGKFWKSLRFLLHWGTLPFKLLLIGGLGLYQIIVKSITTVNAPEPPDIPDGLKKHHFKGIFENLPVFKNDSVQTYVNRVPYLTYVDGTNHNTDHQASRQGTYHFIMSKLGLVNEEIINGTRKHIQQKWLTRGYKYDINTNQYEFNVTTVSGDMLCGLNLAVLSEPAGSFDEYDLLIDTIIENDYALLEGVQPEVDQPGAKEYKELFENNDKRFEKIRFKSIKGMWQPGLETVGAQALTVLAALRIAEVKNSNKNAGKHYRKLLWKYGYGLLSIFPTAYTDKQRGYFNDHNCLISLYVLSKLSTSKLGKLFWKIPMLYVWMLSKHWYNGYFTGLVKDCYPESISDKYIQTCKNYLFKNKPNIFSYYGNLETIVKEVPVSYNNLNADEFSPDIRHDQLSVPKDENSRIKSGLGFVASAVMLEKDPKELL